MAKDLAKNKQVEVSVDGENTTRNSAKSSGQTR